MVWTVLHAKVHHDLRQRNLLPPWERILIAVSGGQDSLCLLRILLDLRSRWGWDLAIAHCDHGWQTDEGMAAHVAGIAEMWQVPFFLCRSPDFERETEAAARQWRYRVLDELAVRENFLSVVTGHTKSDRAETVLFNLLRGSGSAGLGSLIWQRSLSENVSLVRPLLGISRQETGDFCEQLALPVWQDLVNTNLQYVRNRIRSNILPLLRSQINLQVETHLAQTGEILRAENDYLQEIALGYFQQIFDTERRSLNRKLLREIPLAIQRRIVKLFLTQFIPKMVNFEQIEAVKNLATAPNRTQVSSLPGNISCRVDGDLIIVIELRK